MSEVTQADRKAAAEHAGYGGWGDGREHWLANALDSHPLIQAFARHRTTAEAAKDARIAELEGENRRLTEVLRDIAGNGDPDFPSYSQTVARSALGAARGRTQTDKGALDYWSIALIAAWLREQDGHGEWREAADAIDAEFLTRAGDEW